MTSPGYVDPIEQMLRHLPHRGAPGQACPQPNELAALLDGTLLAEERGGLEEHLAGCRDCRDLVADLVRCNAAVEATRRPLPLRRIAAAAVVLVAAGVAMWSHRAAWRESYAPMMSWLRAEEARLGERQRGATELRVLHPRGHVLATRPLLAWEPVAGADAYQVTLLKIPETMHRQTTRRTSLPCPIELERGTVYRLEVVAGARGTRAFRVATHAEASAWREAAKQAEEAGAAWLAPLRRARAAYARRHYLQAELAVRDFLRAHPESALGRRFLDVVRGVARGR